MLQAEAAAKDRREVSKLILRINNEFPLSNFILNIRAYFPWLSDHVGNLSEADREFLDLLQAFSVAESDEAESKNVIGEEHIDRLYSAHRPFLAAFAEVRSQLVLQEPKKLNSSKLAAIANAEAKRTSSASDVSVPLS